LNHVGEPRAPTPSQTVGPFFGFALPFPHDADAANPLAPGASRIEGRVMDGESQPVPDCLVEVWHEEQFARCRTDSEGAFHFNIQKPPATALADGRVRAPYLNVTVFARGLLRHLATFVYFPDEEEANREDPILGLLEPASRSTLIARRDSEVLRFDIHLQGEGETAFFAP
jgi:protocatechuate 3,4-dioxygenase, alpha subunit